MISRTIFKKTIFNLSKALERPPVRSSVRFKAIPNKILMNTIPSILFSTKAPNMLFGKIRNTVSYRSALP